ncbi:MAG: KEOPS complex kinase/ATPase Bud32 [Candidatus Micrarchaeia archaeon]|jgi:Kae1-associated kinase Bud32
MLAGKGAEAEVLECFFLGAPALCKRRVRKQYRIHSLDWRLRTERTKKEARLLAAAKKCGARCPLVLHADAVEKQVFENKLNGRLLREALPTLDSKRKKQVLEEAGRQLALIHAAGIVHGDSTTSNFFLCDDGKLWVIDFGLAENSASLEERATDVLLFKKSVSSQQFASFVAGYAKHAPDVKKVLEQVSEIESRGRYVVRAMAK